MDTPFKPMYGDCMGKADVIRFRLQSNIGVALAQQENCWRTHAVGVCVCVKVKGQGKGQNLAELSAQALLYAV